MATYRDRVLGCWLGKAAGGTLGQPYEGRDGPLNLSFYDPVPGDMIPNDDLDLQVVWACALDRMERPEANRDTLAAAWLEHVEFPYDEYGVALRNLRRGIPPPHSGSLDNWFATGMGAAIRSELWACLAPGDPALAAAWAVEDACVDHAGDGIWAEVFLSALESMAFAGGEARAHCRAALEFLPSGSRLRGALADTLEWTESPGWRPAAVRERILARHGHENFTDVVMNLCFIVIGVLAGEADFGAGICAAVNCGKDTDCTGATAGAVLGILRPEAIPEAWLRPIGRKLVLSPQIIGLKAPPTIDGFTDLVAGLRERMAGGAPASPDRPAPAGACRIPVRTGFAELPEARPASGDAAPGLPADAGETELDGHWARKPASFFRPASWRLVRYGFRLDRARPVRVMVNTPERCRVWLDGRYAFGRDGGRMAPSFHRVPAGQSHDAELRAGAHELLVAIRPVSGRDPVEWVAGLGDPETGQWLPVRFRADVESD